MVESLFCPKPLWNMKNLLLHSLITILTCLSLLGQQNQAFRGKVLYLNSGGQPAIGVQVSGETSDATNSNIVYTTATGDFSLLFPRAKNGQRINIEVGKDDAKGQTIEVVNLREIEQCRMPANGTEVFEVIVCVKGTRERVAQKYYNIIRNSTMKEIERLRKEVKQMILAKTQDYVLIRELTEKITKLQEQTDSISLYREAYRMASINRDNATARMVKYLELLEQGESIEEALKVLDAHKASEEVEENIRSFQAGIDELLTKAYGSFLRGYYEDYMSCMKSIIGHSETLRIDPVILAQYRGELAKALLYIGKPQVALSENQAVLEILENRMDPRDSLLAVALTNQAFYLNANAKFQESMTYSERALNIKETLYAPMHSEFIYNYLNLGNTLRNMGEYQKALEHYKQALSIVEEQENPDENLKSTLLTNMGVTYRQLGKIEKAIGHQQQVLKISQSIYGDYHPETAIVVSNLSVNFLQLGQYHTVANMLEDVIPVLESFLGTQHLDMATAYNTLGHAYMGLGDYDQTEEYLLKTLEIEEGVLDSNHQRLAITYNNLGNLSQERGRLQDARQYLTKAIRILEIPSQSNPSMLGQVYHNLSSILNDLGDFDAALRVQDKALELMQASLGDMHPNLAAAFANRGIMLVRTGAFANAITTINKAIQIDSALSEGSGVYLSFDYNNMAMALRAMEKNQEALEYDLRALAIFKKHFPVTHPAYAKLQSGLGNSYAKTGNLEAAKKAFEIYEKHYGNSAKNFRNWAVYYALIGDEDLALVNLEKSIELGLRDRVWLKHSRSLTKLRKISAFQTLLKQLK